MNIDRRKNMKPALLLLALASILTPASALILPEAADEKTGEGWQALGFPIDDYVPWNLLLQAKEITAKDRKYLVVAGYLVASFNSIILFPNEEASKSGRTDGALILSRDDSPALRWLFGSERAEGFYAVGGLFSVTPKGPQLGHFSKVKFAMKRELIKPPEPKATSGRGAP
jgi:hypothetical protein